MTAWKVSEEPPSGYDVAGKKWRVLLSMAGGWKGDPPESDALDSRIKTRAPGLIRVATKQRPVGAAPVFYDLEAAASLKPEELKEIADAALVGWAEGKNRYGEGSRSISVQQDRRRIDRMARVQQLQQGADGGRARKKERRFGPQLRRHSPSIVIPGGPLVGESPTPLDP